ncbi:MAG: VTT domain-containing protein [Candidatus Acidiferrales bacterium]
MKWAESTGATLRVGFAKFVLAEPSKVHAVRHWLFTLGGPGLILLGLIDSSVIPVPGSMDAMTIVLAGHDREWWPYYAVMATVGSVIGAYLTYRIARNGGEKALKDKVSPRIMKRVTKAFERFGFGAIVIPALLPPPMPMVPFVIAAGALQYSPKKFLAAMSAGRLARYCILAYLGAAYGRKIFRVILAHGKTVLIVTIALVVVAALVLLLLYFRRRRGILAKAR